MVDKLSTKKKKVCYTGFNRRPSNGDVVRGGLRVSYRKSGRRFLFFGYVRKKTLVASSVFFLNPHLIQNSLRYPLMANVMRGGLACITSERADAGLQD